MENQNQEKAARAIGRVAVIGCGRWGSLITWYLSACRGLDVTLYGRPDSTHMQRFLRERRNDLLTLPDSVQLSTDLASALEGREVIVISIGAQGLRGLMEELRPLALRDRIVVLCMKGVEADTGLRLSEIAGAALDPSCRIAVWVGPGHVQEFYAGIPNCMVIDSADGEVKRRVGEGFF